MYIGTSDPVELNSRGLRRVHTRVFPRVFPRVARRADSREHKWNCEERDGAAHASGPVGGTVTHLCTRIYEKVIAGINYVSTRGRDLRKLVILFRSVTFTLFPIPLIRAGSLTRLS